MTIRDSTPNSAPTRNAPPRRRYFQAMNHKIPLLLLASLLFLSPAHADPPIKHVLFYTKSSAYEHAVIARPDGQSLGFAERLLTDLGAKHGFEVVCTKDGTVFTKQNLAQCDVVVFYTCGELTSAGVDHQPPMTLEGKKNLLSAIAAGVGFVGIHSAADTFDRKAHDPYLDMLGGQFATHGQQQPGTAKLVDPAFPGLKGLGDFSFTEEWYVLKNFSPDVHVILEMQPDGMQGAAYQRAPYPQTWAHMSGKGRVFYTALGHRQDVWTNPAFQQLLLAGLNWTAHNVDADITPTPPPTTAPSAP
jgi:uncharacterized protein